MTKTPETIETISLETLDDVNGGRCNNGRAAFGPYGFNPFDKRSVRNFVRNQQRAARAGWGGRASFGYRGYYGGWGWPRYYR
ncbi:MAG: hypothetical protein AB7P03_20060 [Kofleriaceae bacterium]